MNFENIYNLQNKGFPFEEAKAMDAKNIHSADAEQLIEYCDEKEAQMEHLNDLESRGFYHGTDNLFMVEEIERAEVQNDMYEMWRNEY
ncbi:hypothetical protein [Vibrio casei]|uniref:Uncharacterized protein n=1 Tax=Vibrio casei TaxID=673372 RepID=A0A368LG01_9VIBR|nr:hypothetical protein [Vibrio casei]RCS68328.1 hypothetical protein CIK83_18185 [Vibrio casei]RCS68643.1 hypothetical protein CIK83_17145 [Vibrio casei]SJN16162.1 hypothetical protein FM109_00470 [Vibrio casei]